MTAQEAIGEALHIYTNILPDEIIKDPQKIHAIVSIASLFLSQSSQKSHKGQKVKP